MAGPIVPQPLNPHDGFNWVFLVELLISGILTVFFLFYFNRLFATLVSYGIRAYTWHKFHAYIDIQALQISLLGGRVFFKDIRYHAHNETILIHGGHITWQYWLRRVKDASVYSEDPVPGRGGSETSSTHNTQSGEGKSDSDQAEKGGKQTQKQLPCRITIKASGLEAFLYNRSPAYDGIIDAVERKAKEAAEQAAKAADGEQHGPAGTASTTTSANIHAKDGHHDHKLRKAQDSGLSGRTGVDRVESDKSATPRTKKDPIPAFLQFLPVHFEVTKGAIVVGNEHTPAIITAQFEKATGEIDAGESGPLDVYQQVFNLKFTHPVVHMRNNPDYKLSQLESAARLKQNIAEGVPIDDLDAKNEDPKRHRGDWLGRLPLLSTLFSDSSDSIHTHPSPDGVQTRASHIPQLHIPGEKEWQGLTRYRVDNLNTGHDEWSNVEYAKTTLILDSPQVNVRFYWDVTGPVPSEMENSLYLDPAHSRDINGSNPPNYGMDIEVRGGTINYGPWADRNRAILQNVFFPGSHVDATPASPLQPGDPRVLSLFKIYVSIEDDTVLRIPIREPSKDWKWKGKAAAVASREHQQAEKAKAKSRTRRRFKSKEANATGVSGRPFGWIDIKVAGNSSVNYNMDMVASESGFQSKLDVDITSAEISSSVNHGVLWRSGSVTLDCDLSTPLGWNSLRKWYFNVMCQDLELFLLRDHLFLLTDLVADWGSGPGSDYYNFVPFQYLLNIDFADLKLYINTNDSNIVNNPIDLDDNNFIILGGKRLHGDVIIPLDRYRPQQNEISFDVKAQDLNLESRMPSRSTLNTFVRSGDIANLGALGLKGSHTYMTETSPMNTDRLFMDITGKKLSMELYGWVVHHFLKIKDNYFGDDLHFKTSEEFQGHPTQNISADATPSNGQLAKVSNDLDVIISISAEQGSVLLPSNLYSAEKSLRADIPFMTAELRFTNYYMDLQVNFSPLSISLGTSNAGPEDPKGVGGRTELFIDSVTIFGHRLFGLPPTEPTYVCNWDFEVGKVTGECSQAFIERAVGTARSFAFTFDDPENTLAPTDPIVIHDSTFLRLRTQDIHLWFHVATEAILISTGPIILDFNDLAGLVFSERLSVSIPDLRLAIVDTKSAFRHRARAFEKQVIKTYAYVQTSLTVDLLGRKLSFTENRDKQQAHMQREDRRTNRTKFMFLDGFPSSLDDNEENAEDPRAPAMQFPGIPHPVFLHRPQDKMYDSSLSSGSYSGTRSVKERRLRPNSFRSTSTGSFAHSIRSVHRRRTNTKDQFAQGETIRNSAHFRAGSNQRDSTFLSEDEIKRRNLPPTSVALSSSLSSPYFPLNQAVPDLSEVPSFPPVSPDFDDHGDAEVIFNDASQNRFHENYSHTSLIINSKPGILVHCTPEAVRCLSNLVALVLPHRPEDLLDGFHVDVMGQILDHQKRKEGKGSSLEFCVRVPFIHVRFQNEFTSDTGAAAGRDQYDIIFNQLQVATRIKKHPLGAIEPSSLAVHTKLGSLGVSVTEKTLNGPNDDVAVQAELRDLLVWVLKKDEASINVTFKSLEAATASRKITYLASLIHRTTLLSNDLILGFEQVKERHQSRLRYLAWFLTTVQQRFPDPPFLTKASYALRAAKDHLRNHDSWKIISRFRYIWQCLPENEKAKVLRQCSQKSTGCPEGAEAKIIAMWDQWRTWDLAHVKKSLAMRTLFGFPSTDAPTGPVAALYVDVRSRSVKLVVDPGPTESETYLSIITLNIASIPPLQPTGLMLVPNETPKRSTIVQLSTRETFIQVRWEICELIELLLDNFHEEKIERPEFTQPFPKRIVEKKGEDHDLQFIYVSDHAEFNIDTINLQGNATGERLRFSLASQDRLASQEGKTTTVLLHIETGILQVESRSRHLLRAQYDYPSLYFAHHKYDADTSIPDKIKVAGASRMIKIQVEEDILGFIEIIDTVLRDEVAYVYKQVTKLQESAPKKVETSETDDSPSQLPNITLALFMDAYTLELALLQSLTWTVEGSSGRVSVVPALGQNVTLRVDYDLSTHTHRMVNRAAKEPHVISALELPPHNGRLTVTNTESETRISASGIIETIEFQASEIQALVATINRPEVSHIIRAISDDVDVLKTHIEETFPKSPQQAVAKPSKSTRDIVFDVGITLSGLIVRATAPGKLPSSATANLVLKLASMQLKATNVGADMMKLPLPKAIAHLGELSVEMTLSDGDNPHRPCGKLSLGATFHATAQKDGDGFRRVYRLQSSGLEVNIFADTASAVVDVMNHLQDKIKDLDLSKEKKYLKRLRYTKSRMVAKSEACENNSENGSGSSGELFSSMYSLELLKIQVNWIVGNSIAPYPGTVTEDLVLSFRRINFSTRKGDSARLVIEDMQLQMVAAAVAQKVARSRNSALLPEVVFNVTYASTKDTRNIAFQAAGKSLDLRLDSRFVLPAKIIQRSISLATKKFRASSANWSMTPTTSGAQRKNPFGNKSMSSLLVTANFAGAVVHINGSDTPHASGKKESRALQKGRYSQFVGDDSESSMVLQAPGIAVKVEYKDIGSDPSVNAELRIDGSSNTLYPTVVPILIEISDSIKEVVRDEDEKSPTSAISTEEQQKPATKLLDEDTNLITVDPNTLLGRTQLNLGLRICKQEFSLSCQPIARVAAIAKIEDIYVTLNSVKSQEHGHFFAASAAFQKFQAKVQHVYSRESTFGFDVDSVVLSLMNSKHLSGTSGMSAILKINPIGLQINARQLQDFLLFREIWLPPEIRRGSKPQTPGPSQEPQEYLMQRYEQVTAATAFPWNANIAIAGVSVDLDLGQAIGKTSLRIHNLWASSKKSTDWEQNLCIGAEQIALESTGRTSGFVELNGVKVRTTISWPPGELGIRQTPLVQAAIGFDQLRAKTGFDYQAFLIADISNFSFLMYNVRDKDKKGSDRLVAVLDGGKVHVCCTANSAAQGLALFQAIERLVQDNQQAYKQSLKDIEKFLRRTSSASQAFGRSASQSTILPKPDEGGMKAPISLHTDVVVTLGSINFGVFPSTFVDSQIFSIEAADVQARFAVALEQGKIHSGLGMTLGKLSVALASIPTPKKLTQVSELKVEHVLESARSARGGIILRVPKVIANMHTWQVPKSDTIDYIFQSNLEGKVDVGWNYSRISFIRTMWSNHSRSLAQRLGKPLPEGNIKITSSQGSGKGKIEEVVKGGPSSTVPDGLKPPLPIPIPSNPFSVSKGKENKSPSDATPASDQDKDSATTTSSSSGSNQPQEKITAEIKVPQSRYTYHALEPPVIETPQLRDMGEATPPLEWIGLHRDRLPNVTHQVFIVTLLEVAREVEEAYTRILGSS